MHFGKCVSDTDSRSTSSYNALFYGLQLTDGPGGSRTTKAYMKMLESVPAWLESTSDTYMDIHTAALSAWTAMTAHDYQLAWNFHCKACQHVKSIGLDRLDILPAKSFNEETERDIGRYTYWYMLSIDTFFRLFYGKPTVLRYSPNAVRPPLLFRPDNMHPSALHVTISVVWVRYTLLTVDAISYIDSQPAHGQNSCVQNADDACTQMEDLISEWRLEESMNGKETADDVRCLLADHISRCSPQTRQCKADPASSEHVRYYHWYSEDGATASGQTRTQGHHPQSRATSLEHHH
jgi:hypothetical protein